LKKEKHFMALIGYILLAFGLAMTLLDFVGFIDIIPPIANLHVPTGVWIGIAVIGAICAMAFRRARD
jgi:hypothetical protein